MKSTAARKLAEEFINVLKYNPELSHDDKILSLELRLERLISDVEKGCEEAHKRVEEKPAAEPRSHTFLDPKVEWGEAIVSDTPNEQEQAFGLMVKSRGSAN